MKEKMAARRKKAASSAPETGASSWTVAEPNDSSRGLAAEAAKPAIPDLDNSLGRTLTTAIGRTANFNLQLLEIARSNTNSALDFARRLIGLQSPSEVLEVSVAHARKQFESFNEQARQLATLAQEGRADPANPRAVGAASSFARVARTDKPG